MVRVLPGVPLSLAKVRQDSQELAASTDRETACGSLASRRWKRRIVVAPDSAPPAPRRVRRILRRVLMPLFGNRLRSLASTPGFDHVTLIMASTPQAINPGARCPHHRQDAALGVITCDGYVAASSVSRLARRFWNNFGHGSIPARLMIRSSCVRRFALVFRVHHRPALPPQIAFSRRFIMASSLPPWSRFKVPVRAVRS